jgi:spermidine/putrescine transport system permease protein
VVAVQPAARRAPRSAQRTRLWGALLALPTAWMVTFFVSSMVIVVLLSFGRTTNDGFPVFATSTANYRALWNEVYLELLLRSLLYALATVVISVLIAYPVAYAIALHGGRYKNALIAAIVVPFFASYLIRMYAWKALLSDDGLVNSGLRGSGLSDGVTFLNTPGAVVGGLVYGFVVFMILPIYASLEQIDKRLIEAGRDLYSSSRTAFRKITLPISMPGVIAGTLLTFIPAVGDYVNATFLGGPNQAMIGNVIQSQYLVTKDYPIAAALSFVMMAVIVVLVLIYIKFAGSESLMGEDRAL